jgi:RNA polymerase sigma factor (sigma-70 family)
MSEALLRRLVDRIWRAAGGVPGDLPTDGKLLDRYVRFRDEAAFELMVRRHGELALGVCRRMLRDEHAAEDAFQATFLVLARKARSVRQRTVAGWLNRVAQRIALRARRATVQRGLREQPIMREPAVEEPDRLAGQELRSVLDDELGRLPERLRLPVLLCYLEGYTTEQAARLLVCPRGTILSRLATARKRLSERLTSRGVGLPASALVVGLAEQAWSAAVPVRLAAAIVRGAFSIPAGNTGPAGAVSAQAVHLAERVIHAMFVSKLQGMVAVVLVLGVLAVAAGKMVFDAPVQGQQQPQIMAHQGPERLPLEPRNGEKGKPQLDKARDDLAQRSVQLDQLEERRSRALLDARLELLDFDETLQALERKREERLEELRRNLGMNDSARETELRKAISELSSRILNLQAGQEDVPTVMKKFQEQLDRNLNKLRKELSFLENLRKEHRATAAQLETEYFEKRLELRKKILSTEERIRQIERRTAREVDQGRTAVEEAAARVRELEGLPPAAAKSNRSTVELERRIDELQREVNDLRRKLKRQRESK